ncbi:MAG TPA: hypothetical protein VHL59_13865 [Thermoanaerobaculia bacterium]|nr:hypothetical protein [Thermoanaerobaculia bacterium]
MTTNDDSNLISTPGGFRPRSMTHAMPPGHIIRHVQQKVLAVSPEGRPILTLALTKADAAFQVESGWVCYTAWTNDSGNPITSFSTTWTVPPEPSVPGDQTIYLFNGIQNQGDVYGVFQPVLQWGISAAGGGAYWAIASWYYLSNGHAFYSNVVRVNPGDVLTGVMTQTGASGGTFNYQSEFTGFPDTVLPVENVAELTWCNETLEVYWLRECGNYPATPSTQMTNIAIVAGSTPPRMSWTPNSRLKQCGEHIVVVNDGPVNGRVDIFYSK